MIGWEPSIESKRKVIESEETSDKKNLASVARTHLARGHGGGKRGRTKHSDAHARMQSRTSLVGTHARDRKGADKILGQNAPRSWAQRRRRSRGTSRRPLCRPTPARAPRTATRGVILSGDLGVGVRWIMTAGVRFFFGCVCVVVVLVCVRACVCFY